MKQKKLALIAGGGELPLLFLKNAAKHGIETLVFEIEGEGNPGLKNTGARIVRSNLNNLESILKTAKEEKIKEILFLGYVRPLSLLKNVKFDAKTIKLLIDLKDRRPTRLMKSVIDEFTKMGIKVLPTTYLMDEALAGTGFMTRMKTDILELKTVIEITGKIAGMDVGQTVVAGSGMIWAVEAMEGTDNCIRRGGKMAKKGFIVVKMARPKQDVRFDVPAAGLRTIKLIKSLGGSGLVVEAGRTFLLNKTEMIKFADRNNMFIYGWRRKK